MSEGASVPGWFRVVAVLAVLWQAVGCFFYVVQVGMGPEELAQLPPEQAEIMAAMTPVQWSIFAVAVWGGLTGAVMLLLRRRAAFPLLLISVIAAIAHFGHIFATTRILETMPVGATVPLPAAVILLGAGFAWFAAAARRKGWLR